MWATWDPTASLHHGHTAITSTAATERERGRVEIWGGSRKQERHTHMRKRLYMYIWEWARDRKAVRHEQREGFTCSFCSARQLSFVPTHLHLLCLVLSAVCLILPAESSASGCHDPTSDPAPFSSFPFLSVGSIGHDLVIHLNVLYSVDTLV